MMMSLGASLCLLGSRDCQLHGKPKLHGSN